MRPDSPSRSSATRRHSANPDENAVAVIAVTVIIVTVITTGDSEVGHTEGSAVTAIAVAVIIVTVITADGPVIFAVAVAIVAVLDHCP